MQGYLNKQTVSGLSWSFIDNLSSLFINFLVGIILARLLSPSEFGLIGMISVFLAISVTFIDSGLSQALINKSKPTTVDYSTTFYFNIVIAVLCYFVLYLLAPYIAAFYSQHELIDIIRVLSLVLIINSSFIIHKTILNRNINFRIQAVISAVSSLLSGVIAVTCALLEMGVWSLVILNLSKQIFTAFFHFIFIKWKPTCVFSIKSLKELISYGINLLLAGLIFTIFNNAYYLIIGKFYSAAQLGQYSRAEQFNAVCSNNITTVIQRVSFPVLSKVKSDLNMLHFQFKEFFINTIYISIPLILGLAAMSRSVVLVLVGNKWESSIWMLQLLCFSGIFHPLINLNLNLLKVTAQTRTFLKYEVFRNVILIIPNVIIGIYLGIGYMLIGYIIISFIAYIIIVKITSKYSQYSYRDQFRDLLKVLMPFSVISFFLYSFNSIIENVYICLVLQLCIWLVSFVILNHLGHAPFYMATINYIKSWIKK